MFASFRSLSPAFARGLRLAAPIALIALTAPLAKASDVVVPSGLNSETRLAAGPMIAVLADGTRLLSTGFFSADQLSLQHADGSVTLYAQGIGSLSGLAQSPTTGVLVVGDSFPTNELLVIADLNRDGDALDAGEVAPHPVALPVLEGSNPAFPFALSFRPGAASDELYVSTSAPGTVLRVADGAATVYADGFGYAAGMVWVGDTLYVAHSTLGFVGEVYALTDLNDDDDALDAGEKLLFAGGLGGASGLVRATDGSFYLSGVPDPGDFSGAIARLSPDLDRDGLCDAIDPAYISGLGSFSTSLVLFESGSGFAPGTDAEGELWCGHFQPDFSTLSGNVILRSAPHAALSVTGIIGNNQVFSLHLQGEPGSSALAVFALDQSGFTLHNIGDLAFGFGGAYLLVPMPGIGLSGESAVTLSLHNVGNAVGLDFTLQGFALRAGEVGISNAFELQVQP